MDTPYSFVGNNLALDFVNTRMMVDGQLTDLLQSPQAISDWATAVDLPLSEKPTRQRIDALCAFREHLLTLFLAELDGASAPSSAVDAINRYLPYSVPVQVLCAEDDDYQLVNDQEKVTVDQLLGAIARAAAELLASTQRQRLKRCANHACVLLFVDTSKSGRRRWCSMETCGNRAKVKKHYEKTRQHRSMKA